MDTANRWRHLIGEQLLMLTEITGEDKSWEYVRGILKSQCLPESWEDIPEDRLREVFMMLDTHRRRLLKKSGRAGSLSFKPGTACGEKPEHQSVPKAGVRAGTFTCGVTA